MPCVPTTLQVLVADGVFLCREDDGLDALRDAAAGRGRFTRFEAGGRMGQLRRKRVTERGFGRGRGWNLGGSMFMRGCAWRRTTGRDWSGCAGTSRGPRCAASGWSCWRIRSLEVERTNERIQPANAQAQDGRVELVPVEILPTQ